MLYAIRDVHQSHDRFFIYLWLDRLCGLSHSHTHTHTPQRIVFPPCFLSFFSPFFSTDHYRTTSAKKGSLSSSVSLHASKFYEVTRSPFFKVVQSQASEEEGVHLRAACRITCYPLLKYRAVRFKISTRAFLSLFLSHSAWNARRMSPIVRSLIAMPRSEKAHRYRDAFFD